MSQRQEVLVVNLREPAAPAAPAASDHRRAPDDGWAAVVSVSSVIVGVGDVRGEHAEGEQQRGAVSGTEHHGWRAGVDGECEGSRGRV